MKATVERATLMKSLGHVQSVVERRNTIPILSNVLIETSENGEIKLTATDLDLQIVESFAANNVETAGSITVPAHTLFDIVRKLPDGSEVQLNAADGRMAVNAGRARFSLQTLPRDDFPKIAEGDLPTSFEMPSSTLMEIIEKTRFAISSDETRYYLNGIFMHVSDDAEPTLKAAATDGHRLARYTLARPAGAEGMPDVIIPKKCVTEIHKLLGEAGDNMVRVDLSASKIRFTFAASVLTSKLIDGTFPDYNRVIPTGNDKLLTINPKAFFQGVDRVATIATERTRAVKMALEQDKITLSVTSPENGTAAEEVSGTYSNDEFEIGFNANYLKDILNEIESDTVELHLADASAPTLIREHDKSPSLYVLMPMRV
ncbi:DNA polymerase III subunit beta [Sphingorhabdus lutea]|uniref:Beta sliding clamp n=1 Tax=Sphingorhabdus lutea TaxID=1913578 RepID=A0A1L3JBD2_9SPHN|nr:DNA polymerase III subunit beta [Sphingorhabdus lutea]APG62428.1 DNA polymerase III subunit beta [Sphingorhabdus lutea]